MSASHSSTTKTRSRMLIALQRPESKKFGDRLERVAAVGARTCLGRDEAEHHWESLSMALYFASGGSMPFRARGTLAGGSPPAATIQWPQIRQQVQGSGHQHGPLRARQRPAPPRGPRRGPPPPAPGSPPPRARAARASDGTARAWLERVATTSATTPRSAPTIAPASLSPSTDTTATGRRPASSAGRDADHRLHPRRVVGAVEQHVGASREQLQPAGHAHPAHRVAQRPRLERPAHHQLGRRQGDRQVRALERPPQRQRQRPCRRRAAS